MHIMIAIVFLISLSAFSAQSTPFKERFYLLASKCSSVIVEMNSGTLKTASGDDFSLICDPVKGKETLDCMYLYKDGKTRSISYEGGVIGSDGVVTMKNIEQFNINMVTKKFQSDSYMFLDSGRIRGMKVCAGDFLYDTDYKRLSLKEKSK